MRCMVITAVLWSALLLSFGGEPLKVGFLPSNNPPKNERDCTIEIEECIKRVLVSLHRTGNTRDKYSLAERMDYYKVPGVSVAVVEGAERPSASVAAYLPPVLPQFPIAISRCPVIFRPYRDRRSPGEE